MWEYKPTLPKAPPAYLIYDTGTGNVYSRLWCSHAEARADIRWNLSKKFPHLTFAVAEV